MGSLIGHVVLGIVIVLFGIWWSIAQFSKFYQSFMKNGSPYRNSATHNLFFCKNKSIANFEMEGLLKVLFCSIYFFAEVYTGYIHPEAKIASMQHCLILSFFITNGIMDFLVYLKFTIPITLKLNYVTFALTIGIQGGIFAVHNQHGGSLSIISHNYLVYLSYFTVIITILEMKYSNSLQIGLTKSFLVLMLGIWLATVGIIIYPPGMPYAELAEYYEEMPMIHMTPMIFAIEILIVFAVVVGIGGFIGQFYKKYAKDQKTKYAELDSDLPEFEANNNEHSGQDNA